MRRIFMICLAAGCVVGFYFTIDYAYKLITTDLSAPAGPVEDAGKYRLVLISQELDSPFWSKLKNGALAAAERYQVSLEAWSTFGLNEQDFLNNIEIAIASKVDGIIVQGLDSDEFIRLTKLKATGSGIPVITVANDVPANESLRKTYVGSNHYEAGSMIARQVLADMGFVGKVVLMVSDRQVDYQHQRLNGILDVLNRYPRIETEIVAAGKTRQNVWDTTNKVLNSDPDAKAFVAVDANHASVIIEEIEKRARIDRYYIYSFDDHAETMLLLEQGKINALIAQSPAMMGEESVRLMVQWLEGIQLPLPVDGHFTEIRIMKPEGSR